MATERIVAAVETVRAMAAPMVLTARVEHYLQPRRDLDDTIKRLPAYEAAGADVLFATGLPNLDAVRAVCAAVSKPVNVVGSMAGGTILVAQFEEAGVRRISVAGSFYRAAMTSLRAAGTEVLAEGTFPNRVARRLTAAVGQ